MEKMILKFQLQVAFFHLFFRFLPVFQVSTILQTTATNFPEVISKFYNKFCREFIDEENKENQKEIGVKIH